MGGMRAQYKLPFASAFVAYRSLNKIQQGKTKKYMESHLSTGKEGVRERERTTYYYSTKSKSFSFPSLSSSLGKEKRERK